MSKKLTGLNEVGIINMLRHFQFEQVRTERQELDDWSMPTASVVMVSVVAKDIHVSVHYLQHLYLTFACTTRVPHSDMRGPVESKRYLSRQVHNSLYGSIINELEEIQYLISECGKDSAQGAVAKLRDKLLLGQI